VSAPTLSKFRWAHQRMAPGCASAFANCGHVVAHVRGSYVPIGDIQQTKCDGVKELDKRNRGKRVWTQIGWGRSHLIGQPHSLQSACPLGGILLSAKR
jgi:hypothetical protein